MRCTGAMHDLPGNHEALPGIQLHGTVFEIDQQLTLDYVEELVIHIMLVPVILAFNNAQANH